MDLNTLLIIVAVAVIAVIGTVIYIIRKGAKPTQNAAVLYQDWAPKFGLPPLSDAPKAGEENAKILARHLKVIRDKQQNIEEVDLKVDLEELSQEDALAYAEQANELLLEKTTKAFIYDIQDARNGNLRLFTLEKESSGYRNFLFGQAVIKLLKTGSELNEFPDIELPEGSTEESLGALESFVIANAGLDIDPEELYKVTSVLSEKFGGDWNVFLIADDVLKFEKAEEEPEFAEEEQTDNSPFAAQREEKRLADERAAAEAAEAAAKREAELAERRLRWEQAEEHKRLEELAEQKRAIDAGEISPLVARPLAFIAQAIEVAADYSGVFTFDEEADIKRATRIGSPLVFSIYSGELIDSESEMFIKFTAHMRSSLRRNYGGKWLVSHEEGQVSSISFEKEIS